MWFIASKSWLPILKKSILVVDMGLGSCEIANLAILKLGPGKFSGVRGNGIALGKLRLQVAQGYTQEEGIDYDEVFAPVARIESIRLFLAYASFIGFMVYQIDVKIAFLYGTIEEEVYVDDIIFGSTKKELCTEFEKLMHDKFQISSMGELTFFLGLQVKQKEDGIFISQDKYVAKILRKFSFTDVKTTSTLWRYNKPLLKKDLEWYLKGQPKLGLWYPRDSSFDLVAYSDSDYAGASLDRKATTGGCQFLGCRLIVWQCKKQTVVATSSTEAEYVATASCYGQGTGSGSGPRCQDTILGDAKAQIRFEVASKQSNDPPLSRGNTLGSGKDSMKLKELMELFLANATASTLDSGEIQITATIDEKVKIITKASIRRHLKLEDSDASEAASTGVDVRHRGAATTVSSLDA
ncbi:putative ribonuclease H-like domain-containing protein [Tanacetum coccineum]